MDFGAALKSLKDDGCVARKGWNGKGMYLYLVPGDEEFLSFISLVNAKGKHVPWLASQEDMLAEDWYELVDTEDDGEGGVPLPDAILQAWQPSPATMIS